MRVAIYARVSSDEQADRNTVASQVEYLRERCRLDRLEIVEEFVDEGYSGTKPSHERPAAKKMTAAAKRQAFDVLMVYKIDRLARSLRILLDAYELLTAHGASLCLATEPVDTSNPMGRFIEDAQLHKRCGACGRPALAPLDRTGVREEEAQHAGHILQI